MQFNSLTGPHLHSWRHFAEKSPSVYNTRTRTNQSKYIEHILWPYPTWIMHSKYYKPSHIQCTLSQGRTFTSYPVGEDATVMSFGLQLSEAVFSFSSFLVVLLLLHISISCIWLLVCSYAHLIICFSNWAE